MTTHKRIIQSSVLDRMAHADVFEFGSDPKFLMVLFGGSGIDEEEYLYRSQNVIPGLDGGFEKVDGMDFVFVHVCAPYDVPFARFEDFPAAKVKWNAHISDELLSPWKEMPLFVGGFSGGIRLALSGLHEEAWCIGGAALGPDAIPRSFERPQHWPRPLAIYSAPNDRVAQSTTTRNSVDQLVHSDDAQEFRLPSGQHRLADYATDDCFGHLIRRASEDAQSLERE